MISCTPIHQSVQESTEFKSGIYPDKRLIITHPPIFNKLDFFFQIMKMSKHEHCCHTWKCSIIAMQDAPSKSQIGIQYQSFQSTTQACSDTYKTKSGTDINIPKTNLQLMSHVIGKQYNHQSLPVTKVCSVSSLSLILNYSIWNLVWSHWSFKRQRCVWHAFGIFGLTKLENPMTSTTFNGHFWFALTLPSEGREPKGPSGIIGCNWSLCLRNMSNAIGREYIDII